jgi:enhancing lycopene biosynthesis protein 2
LGKEYSTTVTIGNDAGTAAEIEKTGAKHQECRSTEVVIDTKNKLVTSPAYMLATRISDVAEGIDRCVREVIMLI